MQQAFGDPPGPAEVFAEVLRARLEVDVRDEYPVGSRPECSLADVDVNPEGRGDVRGWVLTPRWCRRLLRRRVDGRTGYLYRSVLDGTRVYGGARVCDQMRG